MDWGSLGPLATAVEAAGAPILAAALRAAAPIAGSAVPFPFAGPIITSILNALADSIGGDAADPNTITTQITNNLAGCADKVQAIEDSHKADLQQLLDFAKLQVDQNTSYETIHVDSWHDGLIKLFFVGWRPFAGWTFGFALIATLYATWHGWEPPAAYIRYFDGTTTIFMALIGARTTDKIFGVATNTLKQIGPVATKLTKRLEKRK